MWVGDTLWDARWEGELERIQLRTDLVLGRIAVGKSA